MEWRCCAFGGERLNVQRSSPPVSLRAHEPTEPMRLALIISSLAAGGAERVLSTLANKWQECGHDVTVLTDATTSLDHYPMRSDIKRIALDLQSNSVRLSDKVVRNFVRVKHLRAAIRDLAPDCVIAFGDTVNARALFSCIGRSMRVVVSERVDPRQYRVPLAWRVLRRLLYPFAAAVVVQTESVAQWARRFVPAERVHVIPNPVRPPPPLRSCPDALGTRRTVIAVGRLSREKGVDLLLHAFARAALPLSAWQLVILGDGPERPALEAQIRTLGLQHNVLMPGVVADPERWLQHAELFALSSRFEGFPNALLEAMGCGLAVVAFDCPSGPGEIIRNEQTGLLVPPTDADALTAAIARLAQDPDLRRRLGTAAALDVAQRFNLDRVAALWEATWNGVAARSVANA
jgi:GalNAc-alpha-(1->4)-GalNAc-alpha-(1->3)-diNAcBac-PP-undecaprenol alpha-1,4-N-acetyl-D-galactosaminyltransferase